MYFGNILKFLDRICKIINNNSETYKEIELFGIYFKMFRMFVFIDPS